MADSNAFKGRTDGFKLVMQSFEDVDVCTYALELKAIPLNDGTGESVIKRVPVMTDCYKMQKVIDERTKGADLASIVAKVSTSGDLSLLSQKKAIYGDGYKYPRTMAEALQKGVEMDAKFDNLSEKDVSLIKYFNSLSTEEKKAMLNKSTEAAAPVQPSSEGENK